MLLPNFDMELMYWRMRRCLQRMRGAYRLRLSHERAEMQLNYMRWFGQLPEPVQPEDTLVYRLLWAIVIVGFVALMVFEAMGGEDKSLRTDQATDVVKSIPESHAKGRNAVPRQQSLDARYNKDSLAAWLKKST